MGAVDEPVETYELEEREPEPCPACGATMGGDDALVCVRCGFDHRTASTIETRAGDDVGDEEDIAEEVPAEPGEPLAVSGGLDPLLPIVLVVAALGLLTAAHAMGWQGVLPRTEVGREVVTVGGVVVGTLQRIALTAIWTLCGVVGLIVTAHLLSRPIASLSTAAWRMAAVVAVAEMVRVIRLPQWAEGAVELMLGLVVAVAMTSGLMRLSLRNAATVILVSLSVAVMVHLVAWIVVWAA